MSQGGVVYLEIEDEKGMHTSSFYAIQGQTWESGSCNVRLKIKYK